MGCWSLSVRLLATAARGFQKSCNNCGGVPAVAGGFGACNGGGSVLWLGLARLLSFVPCCSVCLAWLGKGCPCCPVGVPGSGRIWSAVFRCVGSVVLVTVAVLFVSACPVAFRLGSAAVRPDVPVAVALSACGAVGRCLLCKGLPLSPFFQVFPLFFSSSPLIPPIILLLLYFLTPPLLYIIYYYLYK